MNVPGYNRSVNPKIEEFIQEFLSSTDRNFISRNYLLDLYYLKYTDTRKKCTIRQEITIEMQKRGHPIHSGFKNKRNVSYNLMECTA